MNPLVIELNNEPSEHFFKLINRPCWAHMLKLLYGKVEDMMTDQ